MHEPDRTHRSPYARLADRGVPWSSWVILSVLVGAGILLARLWWSTATLDRRLLRDLTLFVAIPLGLGAIYGKNVGWTVNRQAVVDTVLLTGCVLPVYVVGSTLPSVRAYYPMWGTSAALVTFIPYAVQLFVLVLAAETYYRGLLCVGLRELGVKCVLINPVVYLIVHAGKPSIELALAGPAAILFGAVDYRSGSILPSTVAHGSGLVLLERLVLHEPLFSPDSLLRWWTWLPIP